MRPKVGHTLELGIPEAYFEPVYPEGPFDAQKSFGSKG